MPPPILKKKLSYNPFDDGDTGLQDDDDEGFDEFQEAKSTSSSKVAS